MHFEQRQQNEFQGRKTPLRFWNARWVPQQLFSAARRDLSAVPASKLKASESVEVGSTLVSAAIVKA